jgi:hypothetical protein
MPAAQLTRLKPIMKTSEELAALSNDELEAHFLERYRAARGLATWPSIRENEDALQQLASAVASDSAQLSLELDNRGITSSRSAQMILDSLGDLRTKIFVVISGEPSIANDWL